MVKLDTKSGGVVFIRPDTVTLVSSSEDLSGTVVHFGPGAWVQLKGTPEEVHAKLFPETFGPSPLEFVTEARQVLEYVLDVSNGRPVVIDPLIREKARKALGMEGA